tara:strand:- start:272 stop:676 length:405 start_codon:yes stop_codon:yes gene_type:complete
MVENFDIYLSYWILIWFIFYYANLIKYNPILLLILGLIVNTYQLFKLIYYNNIYKGLLFIIINFFFKIIPIYLIRKNKINLEDIYVSIILIELFLLYIYLKYNYTINDLKRIYTKDNNNKKIVGPLSKQINKLF